MSIIYVSCTASKKKFNELFKESKHIPGQQVQKYHRLIMEGLVLNGESVKTITALPVTNMNRKDKYLKKSSDIENGVEYLYLPIVNIPIIKNILVFILAFHNTFKYLYKDKNSVIICDVLNVSVSAGALFAAKILKRKNIGIITDIPAYLSKTNNSLIIKIKNFVINHFSSYVFLTEQINELINKRNVPHFVIEGQVDINMKNIDNSIDNKHSKKICIYAGGIQKIYGVKTLTEAFIEANIPESELHIYGNGDFEEELKEICKEYSYIKYFGVVNNDFIVEEELKATLLINPRPSDEEFTKYSFPSKNMEYMVSGTPALTTNLPGMPEEYQQYVYLIEDETVEGLTNMLRDVLSKTKEELHQKGMMARDYVLRNKNNVLQAKKIINMINEAKNKKG